MWLTGHSASASLTFSVLHTTLTARRPSISQGRGSLAESIIESGWWAKYPEPDSGVIHPSMTSDAGPAPRGDEGETARLREQYEVERTVQGTQVLVKGLLAGRTIALTPPRFCLPLSESYSEVRSGGFRRVALQFPDALLPDAPAVCRLLHTHAAAPTTTAATAADEVRTHALTQGQAGRGCRVCCGPCPLEVSFSHTPSSALPHPPHRPEPTAACLLLHHRGHLLRRLLRRRGGGPALASRGHCPLRARLPLPHGAPPRHPRLWPQDLDPGPAASRRQHRQVRFGVFLVGVILVVAWKHSTHPIMHTRTHTRTQRPSGPRGRAAGAPLLRPRLRARRARARPPPAGAAAGWG